MLRITWNRVSKMLLKPPEQTIDISMNTPSISESFRANRDVFNTWFVSWHISQHEFSTICLRSREEIWDSWGILSLFCQQDLFQFLFDSAFTFFVISMINDLSCLCCHWLNITCYYFIEVFIFLKKERKKATSNQQETERNLLVTQVRLVT